MWKSGDYIIGEKRYEEAVGLRDGEWDSITIDPNPQILNFRECKIFHAVPPKRVSMFSSVPSKERVDDSGRVDKILMKGYCDHGVAESLVGMFREKYKISFDYEAMTDLETSRWGKIANVWRYCDSEGRVLEIREVVCTIPGFKNADVVVLSLTDEKAFKDGAIRAAKHTIDSL